MSQSENNDKLFLRPLLKYLEKKGLISTWMKSKIRISHSRKADANNEKSARSFCFVIIGEHTIHCADSIWDLDNKFIVGILLHEVAHMIVEEDGGDPELGVDEWVIENVSEAKYEYKNARYDGISGKIRTANNVECVSNNFLEQIGIQ